MKHSALAFSFRELRSQRCDNVIHKVQQTVHHDLELNIGFFKKTSLLYKTEFLNCVERVKLLTDKRHFKKLKCILISIMHFKQWPASHSTHELWHWYSHHLKGTAKLKIKVEDFIFQSCLERCRPSE